MTKVESILGWVYLPVHSFALAYLLLIANSRLFPALGFRLDTPHLNVLYYAIGFVFLLVCLFRYLRESFGDMCANFLSTIHGVFGGYVINYFALFALELVLRLVLENTVNPNSAAINAEVLLNPSTMIVVSVLLAPVVEEVLFRGVAFGTIRKSSRIAAYAVSALLFAVYHLWSYMLASPSWDLLLYMLQYIPSGLVLAWCYEKSKSIWGPIFLHMMINAVSISVTLRL